MNTDNDHCSPSAFIAYLLIFVCILYTRSIDENGMDDHDRYWGVAKEGSSRGITGIIYTDGKYDFWANLFDTNPWYN